MEASRNRSIAIAIPFKGLYFSDYRLYLLSAGLIALSIAVPWSMHQFGALGASLLPMEFIVLLAGLALGWRAGLMIGLLTPVASYVLSGMPLPALLPQLTLEGVAFGVAAGLLRERFRLGVTTSLLLSLLAGWAVLLGSVALIYWGRAVPQPLMIPAVAALFPAPMSSASYLAAAALTGLPGLVLQVAAIPAAARWADRWLQRG